MKVNGNNSYLLMFGNNCKNSEEVHELLGITTDAKLTLENHINNLYKKVSQKLNALARSSSSLTFDKRKVIMKGFITSQVSYCPLAWILHSKRLNSKINSLLKRASKITYGEKNS